MVKKAIKAKKVEVKSTDRKEFIKNSFLEFLKQFQPEINRRFNILEIANNKKMRGKFKDYLEGDLSAEDRKMFFEILFELKKEGKLFHIGGPFWARITE